MPRSERKAKTNYEYHDCHMNDLIKHAAIPASGYVYQTLVGIRVLCDWLNDPSCYQWVKFEADAEEDAQGLDDVVVQRSDQLLGLSQVKFTVDPFDPNNALSWDWLLARSGKRGRSLLEKWSSAAFEIGLERLFELALVTNRRPDVSFLSHMVGSKVDLSLLSADIKARVDVHLGGPERCQAFFREFEFRHSYQGYVSLERSIIGLLVPQHTDYEGWLTLFRKGIDWSIRKNSPAPDGRITLSGLRGTIDLRRPRALNQSFKIPEGYSPPDPNFASLFIDSLKSGTQKIQIIWGSPGQGKSTFISHVCGQLKDADIPFIRHHYFIDLADAADRFTLASVGSSLMTQMENEHQFALTDVSDGVEHLHNWIAACGCAYAGKGKPFIVVVDGLDHVWREHDEDVAPLNSLFAQLLPVPKNVVLLLGTQKVSNEQLPNQFGKYIEESDWIELPRMTLPTIRHWLDGLLRVGAFELAEKSSHDAALKDLAVAFENVSVGHPLILTYVFEALAGQHRTLSATLVNEHEPHPSGDVLVYYRSLWQRLPHDAKDALHLMADCTFLWPPMGLERCLDIRQSTLQPEIGHLLASVDAGLLAFHGSLYVFIASRSEHIDRVAALTPKVKNWLVHDAPEFLRWGWLWLYENRLGNSRSLLDGTDKAWVVNALLRAYPVDQIIENLEQAEEAAFALHDYGLAIRKRSLKSRLDHGLTYQLDDSKVLKRCALRTTQDPYPLRLMASQGNVASIDDLHLLAGLYLADGRTEDAAELQERLRRRINDKIATGAFERGEYGAAAEMFLEVAAGTGRFSESNVIRMVRARASEQSLFREFLAYLSRHGDLTKLMVFACKPMPLELRKVFELEAVRMAAWHNANIHEWSEFSRFRKHPVSACWQLLHTQTKPARVLVPARHPTFDSDAWQEPGDDFPHYLHEVFFASVAKTLELNGATDPTLQPQSQKRLWLNEALNRLTSIAHTAGRLFVRGEFIPFSLPYRLLDTMDKPRLNEHESWADYRSVRKALVDISADLFLLSLRRSKLSHIPDKEWDRAQESQYFALEHWRTAYLTHGYRLVSPDKVEQQLDDGLRDISRSISPFNEKANEYAELCEWAVAYELPRIATQLLERSYSCVLGFGSRKDPQLRYVLDAVNDVSLVKPDAARRAIRKLAPIVTQIDKMTEKSGVNESDLADLLLRLLPDDYARYYKYWIDRSDWYDAEQTFAAYARQVDLDHPLSELATGFLWDSTSFSVIEDRAKAGDSAAIRVATERELLFGPTTRNDRDPKDAEETHSGAQTLTKRAVPDLKVEDFPPSGLNALLESLAGMNDYKAEQNLVLDWFRHWEKHSRGPEILAAIKKQLESNGLLRRGSELLDPAFELSYRIEGASKAFQWLVAAQIERHGWQGHHGSDDADQRLDVVALRYAHRWEEFLAASTVPKSNRYGRGRSIPDARLVKLLLKMGENDRAVEILETMVDVAVEEFEEQPLPQPDWLGDEE